MLSDFFPASEMIPEKNRFLPRHCKTLVELENKIIFTLSHFHFLGNWASAAKKCNLSPKYHQSLTFSDIIMRKCAQFSIRVTFSRTLYMYIVDFPQLHRTEDLTKGFEISPNLSMSPFKLFPNVSIQVSELNPDREFMSVCCITTWNKDLKEMLRIVSKNHDYYYYYYYELDLYFLLWIGDGPFPLGETGALENFFIIIG